MLPDTPWKGDTIECVGHLTHKFESDIEFVLVVLTATTALISRLPVENTKHYEICKVVMHSSTNQGTICGCSERG